MKANMELLTRAVESAVPQALAEEKLKSGKQLRVYLGIDPTGSKLHVGHSVPLRKLKAFADAGHHVIFLIGSYTATIGDPTGQDKTRELLSRQKVEENFRDYKSQAEKILDFSKVEIRYNHEWYDAMSSLDFMKLTSHFTVQQMMQRDMFKERMKWKVTCTHCKQLSDSPIQFQSVEDTDGESIEETTITCSHCGKKTPVSRDTIIPPPNPVSSLEILYPILQGYDSVMLDVDCEIGGNDQLFNILCGRKLQKIYGKREKFALTTRLIEGTDGRKMSKTYNNCIYLTDTPKDIFGKTMSIKDELMFTYFECTTDVPMQEIEEMKKVMKKGANPRDFKVRLAKELVTLYHSATAAEEEEQEFARIFRKGELPDDMPEIASKSQELLIDLLVRAKIVPSKSEARRLIEQKGITLNDVVVSSHEQKAEKGIVRVGKRKFARIK